MTFSMMTKDYANVLLDDAATNGMSVAVHAAVKPEENAVIDRNGSHSWLALNSRVNQEKAANSERVEP